MKPTLIMTNGYAVFALELYPIFKYLAQHFRVIVFDKSSWGGNTKLAHCSGLESPQKADAFIVEWMRCFFEAIDHLLPPKYLLCGLSHGGYQLSLFASAYPNRIEKLFLGQPVGFASVKDYNPYKIRLTDKEDVVPPRKAVDYMVKKWDSKVYMFEHNLRVPTHKREAHFLKFARDSDYFADEVVTAMGAYYDLMFSSKGVLEINDMVPFRYFWKAYHPLSEPDRLLNGTKFPIAISFGDRD